MVKIFVLIFIVIMAVGFFFYHQTNYIQVNQVKVSIENLPEEFKDFTIIQITDLHGKCFGQNQSNLLNLMENRHFDILVLTGDMFRDNDEKNSLGVLRHIIDYVHSRGKVVYFVAGNHDLDGDYDYISGKLQEWGVYVLDNRSVTIRRKDALLHVIGIKDALFGMANLDAAVQNVNKGIKILLAHTIFKRGDKSLFKKIKRMKIDLVLSGHTHGFQINLFPFYITGEGLFPKYVKGLHRIQSSYIYISRGLGTSGVNLRLFSRPELTFIRLKSA